jgi:hypothetical protein
MGRAARSTQYDKMHTDVGAPLCSDDTRSKAAKVIQSYADAGRLGRIPGWKGTTVNGYLAMLGLDPARPAARPPKESAPR